MGGHVDELVVGRHRAVGVGCSATAATVRHPDGLLGDGRQQADGALVAEVAAQLAADGRAVPHVGLLRRDEPVCRRRRRRLRGGGDDAERVAAIQHVLTRGGRRRRVRCVVVRRHAVYAVVAVRRRQRVRRGSQYARNAQTADSVGQLFQVGRVELRCATAARVSAF